VVAAALLAPAPSGRLAGEAARLTRLLPGWSTTLAGGERPSSPRSSARSSGEP
jgi:hypothetical protein